MDGPERKPVDRRPLPSVIYNPITLVGFSIALVSLGLIFFLMVLETFAEDQKPYMGIIAFVVLPIFLLFGLALVAFGMWREHRRRRRGEPASRRLPAFDLNDPRHRRAFFLFSGGTLFLLLMSGFGSYKAYEYTDSNEFCGQICHPVMEPEYTAYQLSPHARVQCVDCHIGPGATWYARSKLSGAYQVYSVAFNKYSRPIETPIRNLRPSRETCEQCHWPAHFYGETFKVHDYYLSDDENSHFRLDLLMKIGGGTSEWGPTSGIHWHMNIENRLEYVANDEERQEIPWVRSTGPDGEVTIYRSTELDWDESKLETAEVRTMDCIDCHNRPTHIYHPPNQMVNQAMALNRIGADLPEMKVTAVELLEGDYETEEAALKAISEGLHSFYEEEYPDVAQARTAEIDSSAATLQRLYRHNYFPSMNVNWKEFPNNIGHLYYPGCFRCHDGNHQSEDGRVISRDCNACHTILAQEMGPTDQRVALGGVEYHHPEDIDGAWKEMNCSECHGP